MGTVLLAQVELIASADGEYSRLDRVTITSGRRADPTRGDEVVATPSAAAFLGLHVGSHVPIGIWANNQKTFTPYRVIRMTVVGIGTFNTQVVQDDIDRGNTGFLLGTAALLHELESCCQAGTYDGIQLRGGSQYDTTVEHEYAHLLDTTAAASGASPALQVYVTSVIEAEAQRAIHPEAIALGVFGVIAALAALLIGIQAVSRQLRAGAEDTSVLRAIGAGPPVTSTDGLLGVVGGVVAGSLLAGAVAIGLSPLAPFGPVRAVDPSPGVGFDWTVLGFGMLTLILVIGGVAVALAYRQAPHRALPRAGAGTRLERRAGRPRGWHPGLGDRRAPVRLRGRAGP